MYQLYFSILSITFAFWGINTHVLPLLSDTLLATTTGQQENSPLLQDPYCGDGITQLGESCDDGEYNGTELSICSIDCTYQDTDTYETTEDHCGNGITEPEKGEECDDQDSDSTDLCTNACLLPQCGDGIVQTLNNEICDDGNRNTTDSCSNYCVPTFCGDGSINRDEECEPILPDGTINTHCTEECTLDSSALPYNEQESEEHFPVHHNVPNEELLTMHCRDSEGNRTTDRLLCDRQQTQQSIHPVHEYSEEDIRDRISQEFTTETPLEERRTTLIHILQNTQIRILQYIDSQLFSPESTEYFHDAATWIEQGIAYFSTERPAEEVQYMILSVRKLLVQIQEVIRVDQQFHVDETVEIQTILQKVDSILNIFREAFLLLQEEHISVDEITTEQYIEAVRTFRAVQTSCKEEGLLCGDIHHAIELLQSIQPVIENLLEQHPEIAQSLSQKL